MKQLLFVTAFISLFSFANTEIVKVEAEGFGSSMQQAIDRALTEAMGRVNGKSIESEVLVSSSEQTVTENDSTEYLASQEYKDQINSKTKGVVQSYDIIESGNDGGSYSVKLSVSVVKFKASASSNRKRIAVLPLQARRSCCRVGNTPINENPISEEISAAISAYLVQTRKFTVLDRAYEDLAGTERDRFSSDNVPVTELAKLGQELIADYVLVGTINNVFLREQERKMATVDRVIKSISGNVAISYRIIDVPTGQVKFAETFNYQIPSGDIKSIQDPVAAALQATSLTADKIGLKILEAIYPFVVESIESDKIVIGTGGDVIKVGQQYRLIQYGDKVRDSYTKESLGRKETVIGMIEITEVTPKMSYGKILNSSVQDLSNAFQPKSFIIRSVPQSAINNQKKQSQAKTREKLKEEFDENW
jgi:curli biogenesis system outer membrane secretion channel CsgG